MVSTCPASAPRDTKALYSLCIPTGIDLFAGMEDAIDIMTKAITVVVYSLIFCLVLNLLFVKLMSAFPQFLCKVSVVGIEISLIACILGAIN